MAVNRIGNHYNNANFNLPILENSVALQPPKYDDSIAKRIGQDRQLLRMVDDANETILRIRRVDKDHYVVMTSGGHEIPIEVLSVPYSYYDKGFPKFYRLDWQGGRFGMYRDMG